MSQSLIVNFCPTGMIPTREQSPHVPLTVAEIVAQVREVQDNITMVHLHVRDSEGNPTLDPELYAQAIKGIRAFAADMVICVSLSGRRTQDMAERLAPLGWQGMAKPDMGSLTLGSVNFNQETAINRPQDIALLAEAMQGAGIVPELEAFDTGMVNYGKYLLKKGILKGPTYWNFILGNVGCAQADPIALGLMVRELPADAVWAVGGVGDYQLRANGLGIVCGGGVRVGLEDNIWWDDKRTRLATNTQLVLRVLRIGWAMGRKVMRPMELRELLGMSSWMDW